MKYKWVILIIFGILLSEFPTVGMAQNIAYTTVLSSEVALNSITEKHCSKNFFPFPIRGNFDQEETETSILRALKKYHDTVQGFLSTQESASAISTQDFVELLNGTSEYETAKMLASKYSGRGLPTKVEEQIDFVLYSQLETNPTKDFNEILKNISDRTNGVHPHRKYLALSNYITSAEKALICLANTYLFRPGFSLNHLSITAGSFTTFDLGPSPSVVLTSLLAMNGNFISFENSYGKSILKFSTGVLVNIENQSILNSLGKEKHEENREMLYRAFQEKYRKDNYLSSTASLPSAVLYDLERSISTTELRYDELTTLKYLKRNYLEQLLLHQYRFKLLIPKLDSSLVSIPHAGCFGPLSTEKLNLGIYAYKSEEPEHQGPLLALESLSGELSRTLRNARQSSDQLALIQSSYYQEYLGLSVEASLLLKAKKMLNTQWWLHLSSYCMDQKEGLANGSTHKYCEELRSKNYETKEKISKNITAIDLKLSELLNIHPEIVVEVTESSGPMAHTIRGNFGDWLLKTLTLEKMKSEQFLDQFSKQATEIASQFAVNINTADYLYLIQAAIKKSIEHNLNHISQVCARNTMDGMMSLTQSPGVFWGRASPLFEQFLMSSHSISAQAKDSFMERVNTSYDNLFSKHLRQQTKKEIAFAALSLGGGALSVASFFLLPWIGVPVAATLAIGTSLSAGALLVDTHYYFDYIIPKYQFANSQYHSFTLDSETSSTNTPENQTDDTTSAYVKLLAQQPLPLGSYERYQEAYQQYKWEKVFYYGGVVLEFAGPLSSLTKAAIKVFKINYKAISSASDIRKMFSLLPKLKLQQDWNSQLLKYALSKNIGINGLSDFWQPGNAEVAATIIYAYLLDQHGFSNVLKLRMLEQNASVQSSQSSLLDPTDWEKIKLVSNQSETKNEEILHDYVDSINITQGNDYLQSTDSSVFDYLVLTKVTHE